MQHLEIPARILVPVSLVQQNAPGLLERKALDALQQLVVHLRTSVSKAVERVLRRVVNQLLAGQSKNLRRSWRQRSAGYQNREEETHVYEHTAARLSRRTPAATRHSFPPAPSLPRASRSRIAAPQAA